MTSAPPAAHGTRPEICSTWSPGKSFRSTAAEVVLMCARAVPPLLVNSPRTRHRGPAPIATE